MPLGNFEREVLRVIAANRNPDSFVGGATVLLRSPDSPRSSRDVDLFHDTAESIARSVEADVAALRAAGWAVEMDGSQPAFQRAYLTRGTHSTKVEWVHDSAYRFFPVEQDTEMGWRLNFWDAAVNKVLALFGRHEFRDYVDIHYLHHRHLHLGALVWAAAGKDPGLTPELILDWIKRSTYYTPEQAATVALDKPVGLVEMKRTWLTMIAEADALVKKLPLKEMGCLYLNATARPVCPDPDSSDFTQLARHFGCVKGAWPRVAEP